MPWSEPLALGSAWLVCVAVIAACPGEARGQPLDLSFEQQGASLGIPVGSVGPMGEQWGYEWGSPSSPCGAATMSPDSGPWSGGGLSRGEDYCLGWKVSPAGTFFAFIKDRGTMRQLFTAVTDARLVMTWVDANRASWREIDWFGRPNSYSVSLTDDLGAVQDLGVFQSAVGGGNSYSTPPGDQWWSDSGKRAWQARSSAPFELVGGRTYTLQFSSLSPFWYFDDGGLGGVDDRTTFIDDIAFSTSAGATDAGAALDAGIGVEPEHRVAYRVGCACDASGGSPALVGLAWLWLARRKAARATPRRAKPPAAEAAVRRARLTSFEQLRSALVAGKSVRVVNHYSRRAEKDPETKETRPGADAVGWKSSSSGSTRRRTR